jgi:hypothetical protein
MSQELCLLSSTVSAARGTLPAPRISISIREGRREDIPFIDWLQKEHRMCVGWMPRQQLEGYIEAGCVLVAVDERHREQGYCIAKDRYFKHDNCGIVFQLNVSPFTKRKLIGAALVQATFERAAYGCKLFSCWCAQDIEGNYFWESIGFVPLAFRTGSRGKRRTHIFWQRRIQEGDTTTPFWYPSQTNAGAIAEDRLVFPIPPGTHWSDAKPVVLPGVVVERKSLPTERKRVKQTPARPMRPSAAQGLRFPDPAEMIAAPAKAPVKRERQKNDPKYVAAARELRDRYLEEVNSGRMLAAANGKYEVSRQLEAAPTRLTTPTPLLKAA